MLDITRIACSMQFQNHLLKPEAGPKKIVPTYRTIYGFLVRGNDTENWLPETDVIRTWLRAQNPSISLGSEILTGCPQRG